MEKKTELVKKENNFLEKIDNRPILLVQEIAKLVNSSELLNTQYQSVRIGDQIWMVENLNVDHYRNGDPIPEVNESKEWGNLTKGAWCYYNHDRKNGEKYGKLYNWYAVSDRRGLAPKGWHIPTKSDLEILMVVVNKDGNALKAIGEGRYEEGYWDGAGTNTSGFSALLAGFRGYGMDFCNLRYSTYFWGSTEYPKEEIYVLGLDDCASEISLDIGLDDCASDISLDSLNKEYGFSVRCIKD